MEKYAVIVAGGTGSRMQAAIPKQFLLVKGKAVLWYTLTAFLNAFDDLQIILVLPQQHIETGASIAGSTNESHRIRITTGGETRFQSVKNGLKFIEKQSIVFVHDGVRCLVTPGLIRSCYASALKNGNAIPAVAVTDSIRIETDGENKLVDRNSIRIIQTPQTFLSSIIKRAFEQEYNESFTDEATVVEHSGIRINMVEGDVFNIKITRPIDLVIAEKILEERSLLR
jgi:2-C-methyl-D-erythritol 4-phosphate cytidylyltransferase